MSMDQATKKYQQMIAEATKEYEAKLAAASDYYYSQLEKLHQDVNRQVNNLVDSLSSLTTTSGTQG